MTTNNNPLTPSELFYLQETVGFMPMTHMKWLMEKASTVKSWTELGVYCGRSALAVGLSLPPGSLLQLVEIDFQSRFYPTLDWLLKQRPNLRITLCQNTTVEAAKILPDTEAVFVDDDHTYEGAKASIIAWQHKCKILCGHDYDRSEIPYPPHAGVKKAVDEFCTSVCPLEKGTEDFNGIWIRTGEK